LELQPWLAKPIYFQQLLPLEPQLIATLVEAITPLVVIKLWLLEQQLV
jgi:hypothetical protein